MNEIKNFDERTRIGSRLAEVRKEFDWVDGYGIKRHGITQAELSQMSGVTQANIARIEGGKYNSTFDTLTALASVMGKKIDIV
jgi:DNA-binding XRE family transcriptional regulator